MIQVGDPVTKQNIPAPHTNSSGISMDLESNINVNSTPDQEQQPKTIKVVVNNSAMIPQTSTTINPMQPVYKVKIGPDFQDSAVEYVRLKVENPNDHFEDDEINMGSHISDMPKLTLVGTDTTRTIAQPMMVSGGQVYVLSESSSIANPTIAPSLRKTGSLVNQKTTTAREEKRRQTHNEVERKRRDKINNWIQKLSKILPPEPEPQAKTLQSKGGILSNACDHIIELRMMNEKLSAEVNSLKIEPMQGTISHELQILKKENSALKNENALLKAKLNECGLLES